MDIKNIITSVNNLSDIALDDFLTHCEYVEYTKNHILTQEGSIESYLYILTQGIVRAYSTLKNEEVTFWIGEEGSIVCSMRNYIENKPSYETIELLEDSIFYRIKMQDLSTLYSRNIEIANWGRKFIEYEIIKTENRLISQQFLSAKERYYNLLKDTPHLLQRIPLHIIASYLGVTQVSLSRIRAQI